MENISESNARRNPATNILTTDSTIQWFCRLLWTQILKFVTVDVGAYGKQSGGGVFRYSAVHQSLETRNLKLPEDTVLPNSEIALPHVFVVDEAFPLTPYLRKPYSRRTFDKSK
jgi:hypothetical protein